MPGWLLAIICEVELEMDVSSFARMLGCDCRTLSQWEASEHPLPFHAEFRPGRIILKHDGGGFANGLRFIIFEKAKATAERA
jgi:hypothetical protein